MSADLTVLIVENDQATYQMYQRALQQEYQVLVSTAGDNVLALLKAQTIHAIVLEPGPLGSRGWTLLAEVKRQPELKSIPLILCTAQDERRRAVRMGAAAYLTKPVLPVTLLETVRRLTRPAFLEGAA